MEDEIHMIEKNNTWELVNFTTTKRMLIYIKCTTDYVIWYKSIEDSKLIN